MVSRTRKTSTILHADIVGSSRLAATDEDRALPRPPLGQIGDLIYPAIDPHDGQIVSRVRATGSLSFASSTLNNTRPGC
jgi:class 3 adenylate cyclase